MKSYNSNILRRPTQSECSRAVLEWDADTPSSDEIPHAAASLIRGSIGGGPPLVTAGKPHGTFGTDRVLTTQALSGHLPRRSSLARSSVPENITGKPSCKNEGLTWSPAPGWPTPSTPHIRGDATVKTLAISQKYSPRIVPSPSISATEHLDGFDVSPQRLPQFQPVTLHFHPLDSNRRRQW
jgi:hypothetical protein